jgi:hypothetical protein
VAWDGKETLVTQGVSNFVLVNLNRFTSLPGFFNTPTRPVRTPSASTRIISGTACS